MNEQLLNDKTRIMEVLTSMKQLDMIIKKIFLEVEASSSNNNNNPIKNNIYNIILEAKSSKILQLTSTELKILDFVAEHKAVTLDELRVRLKFKSNRWLLDKCKRLQEFGFVVKSLRCQEGKPGAPFSIYHVKNATHTHLDRAQMVYTKIKAVYTPKPRTTKVTEEEPQEKKYWKCQNCREISKQVRKPQHCIHCGEDLFSRYLINGGVARTKISNKIVF